MSKTNSLSTHVPRNSLEKWIDAGYACPVLLREKYLIYLYIRQIHFKTNPSLLKRMSLRTNCQSPLVHKSSKLSSLDPPSLYQLHFLREKYKIKNLYLQPLPVESVEVFGAPFDLAFIRFLLRVYANVDFQTVRREEGLAAPMLVTDKCVFTCNKSGFCQQVAPIKILKFILKNFYW